MSVAYYIVLDMEEPDFPTFVNGKAVAHAIEELDALCEQLGINKLDTFMGQSLDDIADMLGEEIDLPEGDDGASQWYSPAEGLQLLDALISHIKATPEALSTPEEVLDDLLEYHEVLTQANEAGAKWHLALDI